MEKESCILDITFKWILKKRKTYLAYWISNWILDNKNKEKENASCILDMKLDN